MIGRLPSGDQEAPGGIDSHQEPPSGAKEAAGSNPQEQESKEQSRSREQGEDLEAKEEPGGVDRHQEPSPGAQEAAGAGPKEQDHHQEQENKEQTRRREQGEDLGAKEAAVVENKPPITVLLKPPSSVAWPGVTSRGIRVRPKPPRNNTRTQKRVKGQKPINKFL